MADILSIVDALFDKESRFDPQVTSLIDFRLRLVQNVHRLGCESAQRTDVVHTRRIDVVSGRGERRQRRA